MNYLLLAAAFVVFVIGTILGFGWFGTTDDHPFGWLNLGLALFVLAGLVPFVEARRRQQ